MEEFKDLRLLLDTELDVKSPEVLKEQLTQAEAWGARVSEAYRIAEQALANKKGLTFNASLSSEDKRKIDLEYKVREEQAEVDKLRDLADIIKRRISFGQTIMNSHMAEAKMGIRL